MNTAQLELLATLRVLVGFLGEQDQFGWWVSGFFGPGSKAFFAPVFARTSLLAQYHGVTAAAAKVHDEHIGVGRVYHLFRLPEDVEHGIHTALQNAEVSARLGGLVRDCESALANLSERGRAFARASTEGPILVGDTKSLRAIAPWQSVAGHYTTAFEKGTRLYPYFSDAR
jgi:hypothetical protein